MPRNDGDNTERLLQHAVLLLESIRAHPRYISDFKDLSRDELIRRWPVLQEPLPPGQSLLVLSPGTWMKVWKKRLAAPVFRQQGIKSDIDAFSYDPKYCKRLERVIRGLSEEKTLPDKRENLFRLVTNPFSPLKFLWLKPVHFVSQQALALFDYADQRRRLLGADFLVPVYPWTTEADLAAAVHQGRAHADSSPTVHLVPRPGRKQPNRVEVAGPPGPPEEVIGQSQLRLSSVKPPLEHARTIDTEQFEQQAMLYHLRRQGYSLTAAGRLIYSNSNDVKTSKKLYNRANHASSAFWKKVRAMYDYALTWNWLAAQERQLEWSAPPMGLPQKPPWL